MEEYTSKDLRNILYAMRMAREIINNASGGSILTVKDKAIRMAYREIVNCCCEIDAVLSERGEKHDF